MTRLSRRSIGGRDRRPGGARRASPEPARPSSGYRRWVRVAALGGAKSHVSVTPPRPSAPSETPLTVKYVEPDEPVRTSIDFWPVNVSVLPAAYVWPAEGMPFASRPSIQTFIQAPPPLMEIESATPL